jgi:CIC family chloride channel protein
MQEIRHLFNKLFHYLRLRLTRVQYVMMVAVLVGLMSGLTAVLLKTIVHFLQRLIEGATISRFFYLLFPVFGILICVIIVQKFFQGRIERGIAMVLRHIAGQSSYIPRKHTYQHVVTSAVTVGLGGSVGLEAPIVATGSAIGSNLARWSDLNYQERTLLIACGAAAGISAAFNAPIAGVIFATEVLLVDTVVSYFIPLIISSVVGVLCSKMILQEGLLFNFVYMQHFNYHNVPFYMLLGVLAGFSSLYYAKAFKWSETQLEHLKWNVYLKAVVGGLMLVVLYLVLPPLFGEGYESVKKVANDSLQPTADIANIFGGLGAEWGMILFSALIVLFKPIAAGITIGGGGNGGNFAPSLFTGSFLGFFFSRLINNTGWVNIPVGNFSLVGMAGVLSGVMYCPLTAVFLIAELANGYELFIPLMIVSSISFFIVKSYERYSMDTKALALSGRIFTHQKEKNILTTISLKDILASEHQSICIDKKLRDLVEVVKGSDDNVFAVHDQKGRFAGIIELNDVRQKLFQTEQYDKLSVKALMKKPPETLKEGENMTAVMEKFDTTRSWYLPVLDHERKLLGFVSKSVLFAKYREALSAAGDLYE